MNQSNKQGRSTKTSGARVVLLERSTELSDLAEILEELAIPVERGSSGLPNAEQLASARLVVGSVERLLESGPPDLSGWPRTIAVVQDASKTLSAHLHRIGIAMILTRPIHPRALRLLLLHETYRGPEHRHDRRIAIGHRVRVAAGLFHRKATLIELSPKGARIQMRGALAVGTRLRLQLGRDLTHGRPLRLQGRVLRVSSPLDERSVRGEREVALSILDPHASKPTLDAVLARFAAGPARWSEPLSRAATDASHAMRSEADTRSGGFDVKPASERREELRIPYERRVIALEDEAARVLIGRDLSVGGMRIVSHEAVGVGDVMSVALYCGMQMEPLVVEARALRDDGSEGMLLGFEDLRPSQRQQLEKIIGASSPIRSLADSDSAESEGSEAIVMSELLEATTP